MTELELIHKKVEAKDELLKLSTLEVKINDELKAAQTKELLQQELLRNVLMQAPLMICIFEGPEHIFKFVNPPYQQLVGKREILGKTIAEAMPELKGQPIFQLLDEVYKTGKSFTAHEMVVSLDHENTGTLGKNRYNFTYQALRDSNGLVTGIIVFAYDVTMLVQAREKVEQREIILQDLNQRLESGNKELTNAKELLNKLNQELEERVERRTHDLRLAKAQIENERNRLNHLFMQASAPIVILEGPELRFTLVNAAYQQIFPGRELLGKPVLEALPEFEGSDIYFILKDVYRTGETFVARERPLLLARYDNAAPETMYWTFTYQARKNEKGEVDGVLAFAYEVTDQVIARQEVEKAAQRLQLITDAMPVLIGYLDKEEKYQFANKAYVPWFGLNPNEIIGRHVCEILGEKAYLVIKKYIGEALAGKAVEFEAKMAYREDFIKYIKTSYIPDTHNGKVHGFYTLVTDVTEQVEARQKIEEREKETRALAKEIAAANVQLKAANDGLAASNEKLSMINSDLDNFIYTASHDLKAPISNIEGLMSTLIKQFPPEFNSKPLIQKIVTMIESSIDRFKKSILDLTEITKLQKGFEEKSTKVDLERVLEEVKLDLEQMIEETGTKINIKLSDCRYLNFTEKNLRSLLYNLISNAIKYRSPHRQPTIEILTGKADGFCHISVKDNGLGIPETQKGKIFSMFKRVHTHVEGSGIGLYIVKKIIENAGGRIEIESEVGKGSVFKVFFKEN